MDHEIEVCYIFKGTCDIFIVLFNIFWLVYADRGARGAWGSGPSGLRNKKKYWTLPQVFGWRPQVYRRLPQVFSWRCVLVTCIVSEMPHTKIEKCPVCNDRHTVSECNSTDCQRSGGCKQSYVVNVMCSSCKREAERMKLWNGKKDFADYDLFKKFY